MRAAILISDGHIWPHHCHFLAKLRSCTEVVGAMSFPSHRAAKRRRLLKKFALRNPFQIFAVLINRLRWRKVALLREKSFEQDRDELGNLKIVNVDSMEEAAEQADKWNVNFMFQFTAGIISEPLLSAAPYGVLSFHHGIMPLLRGLNSPFWAIYLGRPECLGITLQRLAEKLDAGTILAQTQVTPRKDYAFADIVLQLDKAGAAMIEHTIKQLANRTEWLPHPTGGRIYRSRPKLIHQLLFSHKLNKFRRKFGS